MLRPVFGAQEGASLSPGVFSELRFDRNLLRPSAGGTPIAVHRANAWEYQGRKFVDLDCEGRVMVYFGNLDGTLGPGYGIFEHLFARGGVLYADEARFATYDADDQLWSIDNTSLRCPVLVARAPD